MDIRRRNSQTEGELQNGGLVDVFAGNAFMGQVFTIVSARLPFDLFHATPMMYLTPAFGAAGWNMPFATAKPSCPVQTLPVAA